MVYDESRPVNESLRPVPRASTLSRHFVTTGGMSATVTARARAIRLYRRVERCATNDARRVVDDGDESGTSARRDSRRDEIPYPPRSRAVGAMTDVG